MIIDDQQTISGSLNATINIKFLVLMHFRLSFYRFPENKLNSVSFWARKMFFFFKWVRISPEIDWYHHQWCFPDKMSYDPTFLVKIDILTDRTFCSPTVHWRLFRLGSGWVTSVMIWLLQLKLPTGTELGWKGVFYKMYNHMLHNYEDGWQCVSIFGKNWKHSSIFTRSVTSFEMIYHQKFTNM